VKLQRLLERTGGEPPRLRNLRWKEPGFRAALRIGQREAEVRFEALEHVRVRMPAAELGSPREALEASRSFPGNLRFARNGHGLELLADAWGGGEGHPARTALGEIASALSGTRRARTTRASGRGKPELERALRAEGALELVPHPEGFDLRVRLPGATPEVQVRPTGSGGLWLSLGLPGSPPASACEACDRLALELNARVAFARIVTAGAGYAVEARLSAELVSPRRVADSARAVAAVAESARGLFAVLFTEPHVVELYTRFTTSDHVRSHPTLPTQEQ
jgi:hypothetical protein